MKRWTFTVEPPAVYEVECVERGYPNPDGEGQTQYENTHYDNEADAWAKLIRECEAGVSLDARARARIRTQLEEVTRDLADGAERLVKAKALCEARQTALQCMSADSG